jgi:hypothetical protein
MVGRLAALGFLPRGAAHSHWQLHERLDDHFEKE